MFGPHTVEFMDKWQTLIGSALGPFLAIILSAFGFLIASAWNNYRARKEGMRIVEVTTTQSVNDIYDVRLRLEEFVSRIRQIAHTGRQVTDDKTIFFEETNFPPCRDSFVDDESLRIRLKSSYLHNRLLSANSGLKETNYSVRSLEKVYETIIRRNQFLIAQKVPPKVQRGIYVSDLIGFAKTVEDFLEYVDKGITVLMQIKIYNQKLRNHRLVTLWRYEWVQFRFFKSKKDIEIYRKYPDFVDRINKAIENEVSVEIEAGKKQIEEHRQKR